MNTEALVPDAPATAALKVLDALPGLVGAIDRAIIDTTGQKLGFVLLVFAGGQALHATNVTPASSAIDAMKALVHAWDETPGGVVEG